jgi:ElaB/YqjD/DUF883 family membrane-anchored ribosome-binding protein
MSFEPTDSRVNIEDHRRWQMAQRIVEDNTGFWQRVLADTRERPATSVALAFGVGLIIGLVLRRG